MFRQAQHDNYLRVFDFLNVSSGRVILQELYRDLRRRE